MKKKDVQSAIIGKMHKKIYASGFIYNTASQQILLQQLPAQPQWSLFIGDKDPAEKIEDAFQRIIKERLGITIPLDTIYFVYDYVAENDETHYIAYAEKEFTDAEIAQLEKKETGWFSFKQLQKLSISPQHKQDIIIAQRVIHAREREKVANEAIQ